MLQQLPCHHTVIADWRERASGIPRALSKKGLEVRMQHLIAGDYILSPQLAVERKTTADFTQSIIDKRLFAQVGTLRACFQCPLLLLEETSAPERELHPNALRGAILYVSVLNHIPILRSASPSETVEILHAIVQLLHAPPDQTFTLHTKRRTPSVHRTQRYVLETLPGIGPRLADSLLKKFGNLHAVFAARPEELTQVAGVGRSRAAKIHEILNREYRGQ